MTKHCRSHKLDNCLKLVAFLVVLILSGRVSAASYYCDIDSIDSSEIVNRIASQFDAGAKSECKNLNKTTYFVISLTSDSASALTVCDTEMQLQFGGVPSGWVITTQYTKDDSSSANCDWVTSTSSNKYKANKIEKLASFASSSSSKKVCVLGRNVGYNEVDLAGVSWFVSNEIPTGDYCGDTYIPRLIRKAASGLTMCATYAQVPNGFTVSQIVNNDTSCSTALFGTGNKYVLGKAVPVTGSEPTCILPSNYEEYSYTIKGSQVAACAGGIQYSIGRAFDGGFSCSVPSGWGASGIVSETNTELNCSSNFVYKLAALKDGLITCFLNNGKAPQGYVVSSYNSNVAVCNGPGYTIRTPKNGVYMCDAYSSIPEGFWYGAAGAKNGCTSGYDLAILPDSGKLNTCGEPPTSPPNQYVYTSISNYSSCPAGKKQYTVGSAGNPQQICYVYSQNGPIPQGYVISSDRSGPSCAAGVPYTIREAYDGLEACSAENMPAGFAIGSVKNSTTTNCTDYAIVLKKLDDVGPYTICSTHQVPQGYVITAVDDNSVACAGKGFEIRKPILSGDGATFIYQVCADQPMATAGLPEGMVIRKIFTDNTPCGVSGFSYQIGFPFSSKQTVACQNFGNPQYQLPAGFNAVTTSTFIECNGGSGWLLEPAYVQITPQSFVLPEPDIGPTDITPVSYDCGTTGTTGTNVVVLSASKNTVVCP